VPPVGLPVSQPNAGGASGPAGVGFADLFVSPANEGAAAAIPAGTETGDFTVGIGFQFLRPCSWTGVRFAALWTSVGTRIWRARASIVSLPASEIGNVLSAPLPANVGVHTILWPAPIPIVNINFRYAVCVYDTTAGADKRYAGYTTPAGYGLVDYEEHMLLGPSVWKFQHHSYVGGDVVFTNPSNASTDTMAVEPLFTVP
jgi:hypothetical protein